MTLAASVALDQPLAQWLRLLWDAAPPLHLDSAAPYIAGGAIHLPARTRWQQHCPAAAHAAAHLVYSPVRFAADGLVPIARALLALLEDARVEALATRELPGLVRLWRPEHRATPDDGNGFEALMARLARALADPLYDDPHPWVSKGRRLFYLDERLGLLALRTPAELRGAALRLGHDIGQMRLPFNASGYRPQPAYRDDHRWMWAADQLSQAQPQPPVAPLPAPRDTVHGSAGSDQPDAQVQEAIVRHPEWDRLIERLRPDWCRVIEQQVPVQGPVGRGADAADVQARAIVQLGRRLVAPLRGLIRPVAARRRGTDGEIIDLDALVGWCLARRSGRAPDGRVYRTRLRRAAPAAMWLLVDRSASAAAPLGTVNDGGPSTPVGTILQAAARSAAATALGLQALGVPCTVVAFSSSGRQAVRLSIVKTVGQRADGALAERLLALGPGGSTRLGAALRHATARLGAARGEARWVLLISDGQPHDVDVHDPRYLVDDARHAVAAARRRGVGMACLTLTGLAGSPAPAALRSFGRRGTQSLSDIDALPRALRRLAG